MLEKVRESKGDNIRRSELSGQIQSYLCGDCLVYLFPRVGCRPFKGARFASMFLADVAKILWRECSARVVGHLGGLARFGRANAIL